MEGLVVEGLILKVFLLRWCLWFQVLGRQRKKFEYVALGYSLVVQAQKAKWLWLLIQSLSENKH